MQAHATFLDAVKRLYPFGVPISSISSPVPKKLINFVYRPSGDAELAAQGRQLLQAAITKGLGLSLEDVVISDSLAPDCEISLQLDGQLEDLSELHSYSPEQVVQDSTLKRRFWEDLKRAVSKLSERQVANG